MSRPKQYGDLRLAYCQYLLSSQVNYTLTNYSEHVETVTHDAMNKYLSEKHIPPRMIWDQICSKITFSDRGYILFDDTVLNKEYSKKIEGVRYQYSGNAHRVIRGIGVVNCVYVNPETKEYWVIDYRVYDPERDGKGKPKHVMEMLLNTVNHKKIPFKTVLMDSWYASTDLMLLISDLGKIFYCPLKSNRLVRPAGSTEHYQHVSTLNWSEHELLQGRTIRLKGMPRNFFTKLFRVPISTDRIDHVVTNETSQNCSDDTRHVCAIRWLIEQFHREAKQLTGIENCQCRKQRIQRNHIACAMFVWARLKQVAYLTGSSAYQVKRQPLSTYLSKELKNPTINVCFA